VGDVVKLGQGLALVVEGDRGLPPGGPDDRYRPFEKRQRLVKVCLVLVAVVSFTEDRRQIAGV
jgi:hypothetical protein